MHGAGDPDSGGDDAGVDQDEAVQLDGGAGLQVEAGVGVLRVLQDRGDVDFALEQKVDGTVAAGGEFQGNTETGRVDELGIQ